MPTKKRRPIFLTLMIAVIVCAALLPVAFNIRMNLSRSYRLDGRSFNPIIDAIENDRPTTEVHAIIEKDPAALRRGFFAELVVDTAVIKDMYELFEPFAANGIHLDGAFHTGTEFGERPQDSPLVYLVSDGKIEGVQALLMAAQRHGQSLSQLDKAMKLARQYRHEEIQRALQSHKEMTQ